MMHFVFKMTILMQTSRRVGLLRSTLCDFRPIYCVKLLSVFCSIILLSFGRILGAQFHAGDCWLQPPGVVHNELACSGDLLNMVRSPAIMSLHSSSLRSTIVAHSSCLQEICSPAAFATTPITQELAGKAMAKVALE